MKKQKARKRRGIFLKLLLAAFLCYGLTSLVMLQMDLAQKNEELDVINKKIVSQQQTNEELKTMGGRAITANTLRGLPGKNWVMCTPMSASSLMFPVAD